VKLRQVIEQYSCYGPISLTNKLIISILVVLRDRESADVTDLVGLVNEFPLS